MTFKKNYALQGKKIGTYETKRRWGAYNCSVLSMSHCPEDHICSMLCGMLCVLGFGSKLWCNGVQLHLSTQKTQAVYDIRSGIFWFACILFFYGILLD